jgi:nicotinamidase-related amidase
MQKANQLRFGPLGAHTAHICVDMQRLFAEDTEWKMPWMRKVLPNVVKLVAAAPSKTVFTRFLPAQHEGEGHGAWKRYYERWANMTLARVGAKMIGLVPELERFVPPAAIIDKHVYSPWYEPHLYDHLAGSAIDSLILSGGETEICVLATVLGAVDHGYRVVIATDALCSSSDGTHDALLSVYQNRYSEQIETVTSDVILAHWQIDAEENNARSA